MKLFLAMLSCLSLLAFSSDAQAGQAQWYECSSTYKGSPVSARVCAVSRTDASFLSGMKGMCGPATIVPTAEQKACYRSASYSPTHNACVQ